MKKVDAAILIKRLAFYCAVLVLVSSSEGNVTDLGPSIPKQIQGWPAAGPDQVYDTKTLYDYLDGGAEMYLAFDLKRVFVRKYKGPAGAEIALDIYEMGSPGEAFGVFSSDRQDPEAGIGQESEYGPGLLRFRQGCFFVSVTASGDEQGAREPILALGKAVAPLLGPKGAYPALLELLPPQGLKRDRTSYFHSVVNLNNRFFVSAENILRLDKKTECAFAEYAPASGETVKLLLIRYPDEHLARAARDSFLSSQLPMAIETGSAKTERGSWTMARLRGCYVAVIFDAPSEEIAAKLQAAIRYPSE